MYITTFFNNKITRMAKPKSLIKILLKGNQFKPPVYTKLPKLPKQPHPKKLTK